MASQKPVEELRFIEPIIHTKWWIIKVNISHQTYPEKIANLISKLNFYKLIPYPMDIRSAQTGPPNVRKRRPVSPLAGRSVVPVHSPDGVSYFLPV